LGVAWHLADLRNNTVSIGTTPVLHMQLDPETLVSRLKLLHGQFWG
jgi:hypothetical protein